MADGIGDKLLTDFKYSLFAYFTRTEYHRNKKCKQESKNNQYKSQYDFAPDTDG